jgi:hypothetical protein
LIKATPQKTRHLPCNPHQSCGIAFNEKHRFIWVCLLTIYQRSTLITGIG